MSRQHAIPLMISPDGVVVPLRPLGLGVEEARRVSEAQIQNLVAAHPECLPIREIDPLFDNPISVCTELVTRSGSIDNFMVTTSGLPVLVECKLWRNTQSRREVVGQIIDYAKALSTWTTADLHREINKRSTNEIDSLLALVRARDPSIDEASFNDSLGHNLRRGRFLLLLVGDGIRENVEEIVEYVQKYAGLHFTLGIVELPLFECADGSLLVAPRVMAQTLLITRNVIAVPESLTVEDDAVTEAPTEIDPVTADRTQFWTDFLADLKLDDPSQSIPRTTGMGSLSFMMPVPGGTSWLTVYRNIAKLRVGVFVSFSKNSLGERATMRVLDDLAEIRREIGNLPTIELNRDGRKLLTIRHTVKSWTDPESREEAIDWLREQTNTFVNAFRPRLRDAAVDLGQGVR